MDEKLCALLKALIRLFEINNFINLAQTNQCYANWSLNIR